MARAYISFDSEGAVESALSTEACIQGICLEVKRLPYEQDEDRGRQRDKCSCDTSALFKGRDGPHRQTGRGKDRDDERGRERVRYNEREITRGRELGKEMETGSVAATETGSKR